MPADADESLDQLPDDGGLQADSNVDDDDGELLLSSIKNLSY